MNISLQFKLNGKDHLNENNMEIKLRQLFKRQSIGLVTGQRRKDVFLYTI